MVALVSVVIPSRLAPVRAEDPTALWLERAIGSVRRQALPAETKMEIIVGIDHGTVPPEALVRANRRLRWAVAPRSETGQAAAVNAAATKARGEYLAILEDDDRWRSKFLKHALTLIDRYDFVSSNQLEILPNGKIREIFDFPTPSGWLMRRELWDEIGGMDTSYRYHIDNDWLARLSDAGKRRVHLIEATAPENYEELRTKRSFLARYVDAKPGFNFLFRHDEKAPLVLRTRNPEGGMSMIRTTEKASAQSRKEYARLRAVYGRFPI